jgi:integrase
MRFDGESLSAAVKAEGAGATALAAAYSVKQARPAKEDTVRDIVVLFKSSPSGAGRLAESTHKHWTRWLDEIIKEFGTMPVKALKAKGVRRQFTLWRDRRASTPRAADYGVQVLKRVLSWAFGEELIEKNPALGIEMIYSSNRADIIIEDTELQSILAGCTRHAAWAIRLAAATGIRRGDLVRITWDQVSEFDIGFNTSKSNFRQRATVPLLADARALIAEIRDDREQQLKEGRVPSAYVLTSHQGRPWTADGLTQAFLRAARKVGIKKHLHDLRGTAATRFILGEFSNEEVAEILGWEVAGVGRIRKRYVDGARIARGLVERLEKKAQTG